MSDGYERTPDGWINNCAVKNGAAESGCQICGGKCPDIKALTVDDPPLVPEGMLRSSRGGFINRTRAWSEAEVAALAAAAAGEVEAMRAHNLHAEATGRHNYQTEPGPIHARLVLFLSDRGIL